MRNLGTWVLKSSWVPVFSSGSCPIFEGTNEVGSRDVAISSKSGGGLPFDVELKSRPGHFLSGIATYMQI